MLHKKLHSAAVALGSLACAVFASAFIVPLFWDGLPSVYPLLFGAAGLWGAAMVTHLAGSYIEGRKPQQ
jgi:hypothetical protein